MRRTRTYLALAGVLLVVAGLLVPLPAGAEWTAHLLVGWVVGALAFCAPVLRLAFRLDADATADVLEGAEGGRTETDAIVVIGEIGGDAEERAAAYVAEHVTKPVVGYVAGFTAPEGKTMGHAGAIVSGSSGTAAAKKDALEAVGVRVGKTPSETARLMRAVVTGSG